MHSFPYNAVLLGQDQATGYPILDRTAGADDLRMWIKALMTDGVHLANAEAFAVTPSEGMKVLVSPGMCIIEGTPGQEPNTRELALQASASQDRIDTIVIRWDDNRDVRNMDLYVKTGVASATPVRPTLTRTETIKELGICDIYIPANSTSVSQERITDTRLDNARCGMVTAILEIDTTTFFNQLQAATDKAIELSNEALEGTIAGELQSQIDEMGYDSETGMFPLSKIPTMDADHIPGLNASKITAGTLPAARGGTGITNQADAVIGQGISGIWHYQKFDSGTAICWGSSGSIKTTTSTAFAGGYRVGININTSFPFTFAGTPAILCSRKDSSAVVMSIMAECDASKIENVYAYVASNAALTFTVTYFVIGRWK